jgi:hypothetical protein
MQHVEYMSVAKSCYCLILGPEQRMNGKLWGSQVGQLHTVQYTKAVLSHTASLDLLSCTQIRCFMHITF